MQFEGIYTPLVTPHRDDFSINHDALAELIERLISAGVHGLVLGGTTGEYYAQNFDERIGLMRFAKEQIRDRVPLIVGVSALRTEDAVKLAVEARGFGADALLVGSPYYASPTGHENAAHALAVDRAADLPIMLYNYPARTGASMDESFLDRVGRSANFRAIKESSGDPNRLHLLARNYPHIQLACGMDDQALEFFAWGATSWVCAASNFLPEEHLALYRACVLDNDFVKGRRIMSAMLPLMGALEQGGKFVQSVKFGCELGGMAVGPARKPLRNLRVDEQRGLKAIIRVLRTTIANIMNTEAEGASNVIALDS